MNSLGFAPQSRIKGFGAAPRLELKVSVQLLRPELEERKKRDGRMEREGEGERGREREMERDG